MKLFENNRNRIFGFIVLVVFVGWGLSICNPKDSEGIEQVTHFPKDSVVTQQESITLYSDEGGAFKFASLDHATSFQELNGVRLSKRCDCYFRGEELQITENEVDSLQRKRSLIWCENKPHVVLIKEVTSGYNLLFTIKYPLEHRKAILHATNVYEMDSVLKEVSQSIEPYVNEYRGYLGVFVAEERQEVYPVSHSKDSLFFAQKLQGKYYKLRR